MMFLFFMEFAQLDWAADSQSLLHDIANKSLSISRLSLPQKVSAYCSHLKNGVLTSSGRRKARSATRTDCWFRPVPPSVDSFPFV